MPQGESNPTNNFSEIDIKLLGGHGFYSMLLWKQLFYVCGKFGQELINDHNLWSGFDIGGGKNGDSKYREYNLLTPKARLQPTANLPLHPHMWLWSDDDEDENEQHLQKNANSQLWSPNISENVHAIEIDI